MENLRVFFADQGFRRYDIMMRVIDYPIVTDGNASAEDLPIITDTILTIQGRRIGVGLVATKDVVASGGSMTDIDYRIGPITPTYTGAIGIFPSGGMNISGFEPPTISSSREIYYKLTGPGMENGAWFKKISQEVFRNWSYVFTVRKLGDVKLPESEI